MKKNIHPKIFKDCAVTCVCGNKFTTISTQPSMSVDICSNCHPFFTGQQKFIDAEGRIDKFNKKAHQMEEKVKQNKVLKEAKKAKKLKVAPTAKPTLRELMDQVREEEPADTAPAKSPDAQE